MMKSREVISISPWGSGRCKSSPTTGQLAPISTCCIMICACLKKMHQTAHQAQTTEWYKTETKVESSVVDNKEIVEKALAEQLHLQSQSQLLRSNVDRRPMFVLSLIEHTFRMPPALLSKPLDQAIKGELETLFLDKVIPNLGLCVSVYDIRSINGGFIFAGDGASTFTVEFRLIMFRPFVGEIISGVLEDCDANGLRLSLGFFKDIILPVHNLPVPSKFVDSKWTWDYQGLELTIEKEDEIRFRVHSVHYPPTPLEPEKDGKPFAPMVITVSIDSDGLGPLSWWV